MNVFEKKCSNKCPPESSLFDPNPPLLLSEYVTVIIKEKWLAAFGGLPRMRMMYAVIIKEKW